MTVRGPATVGHKTKIAYQRGWDEYRPECSCGWIGSYWKRELEALMEARKHANAKEAE